MKAEVLSHFNMLYLTCTALVCFVALFTSSVIWVYRKSGKRFYNYMENLPLDGDA